MNPHPNILVICRPILGDTVLAAPVFRSLRAWRPEARIVAACYEGKRDLLSIHPEIDEIAEMPDPRRRGRLAFLAAWFARVRSLRKERFDLVCDLMQTDRSSLLCALTGAPSRVGFLKGPRRIRHRVYTELSPWADGDGEAAHAVDLYFLPLARAGVPMAGRSVAFAPGAEAVASARARIGPRRSDRPLVACHPGASAASKCWLPAEFASVCDEIHQEMGADVLLLGGPAEQDALREIRSRMRSEPRTVEGVLPLRELAAVLAEADLFLCHDSGPMHVAAAVGTPVVALFGASSPAQWRPLGEGHTIVRPTMPCEPCAFPSLCSPPNPYRTFCVRRVTRDEVLSALRQRIAECRERRGAEVGAGAG